MAMEPQKWSREGNATLFDLLRSIGFEVLAHTWIFSRARREAPKTVITKSRRLALTRCAIHVFPICVSINIIVFNTLHIFLGRTLPASIRSATVNIALLQVAAKLQELLIVSSTAVIVHHILRHELLHGDGVPLGMLGGGFQFTQLSYFWSADYWGALLLAPARRRKRLLLAGVLLVAGFIATTAGPACAVLVVPRIQDWTAGGGTFYLPGNSSSIWPNNFTSSSIFLDDFCTWHNASLYRTCPSGGFESLKAGFSPLSLARNFNRNISQEGLAFTGTSTKISFENPTNDWSERTTYAIQLATRYKNYETSALGVHVPTTIFNDRLMTDWFYTMMAISYSPSRPSKTQYKYLADRTITPLSRVPVVRAVCSEAQNLSASQYELQFPVLPKFSTSNESHAITLPLLNQTIAESIRTTWVPSSFLAGRLGSASTALVFETRWERASKTRTVLGCSIDARWVNAEVTFDGLEAVSKQKLCPGGQGDFNHFCPNESPAWSSIDLAEDWLDLLTPADPVETSHTTLESILIGSSVADGLYLNPGASSTEQWEYANSISQVNRTLSLERILATVVADGLSRNGFSTAYNLAPSDKQPPLSFPTQGWTPKENYAHNLLNNHGDLLFPPAGDSVPQRAKIIITGYAYMASAFTDWLALALLCTHIALALGHTIVLTWNATSSGCWDSITEMIALLINSPAAPIALGNTCAGIKSITTHAKLALIRGIYDSELNAESAHAELLMKEDERATTFRMTELHGSGHFTSDAGSSKASSIRSERPLLMPGDMGGGGSARRSFQGSGPAFATGKHIIEVDQKYGELQRRRDHAVDAASFV